MPHLINSTRPILALSRNDQRRWYPSNAVRQGARGKIIKNTRRHISIGLLKGHIEMPTLATLLICMVATQHGLCRARFLGFVGVFMLHYGVL